MANRPGRMLFGIALIAAGVVGAPAFGQFYNTPKKPKPAEKRDADLKEYRDEADEVLALLSEDGSAAIGSQHWSIVIFTCWGEDQAEVAELSRVWLHKVQAEAGLTAAYLEKRDKAVVIAYGQYAAPDDPDAQADLERIRTLTIDGGQPFAGAILTPPSPQHLTGSLPELDLRNAKKLFGEDKALYTLQVAIYGRADRSPATAEEVAEFRKAAEQAAVLLRRDGELAFYYHAPERSMVTVGVFGQEDYDPLNRPGQESYPLILAREHHPLNLLNGKGIRERIAGAQGDSDNAYRLQPSMLVAVPES